MKHLKIAICFVFIMLAGWWGTAPFAQAQGADSVFTVTGVHVEVEAADANTAKSKALQQARQDAFQILLKRLVAQSNAEQIKKLSSQPVQKWVQAVELRNERTTASKYSADVTVIFKSALVEAFLENQDVSYTTAASAPFLVIPVYNRGDQWLLLQEDSLWLSVWRKIQDTKSYGLVPIKVPLPSVQIQTSDIVPEPNRDRLLQLAAQHGVAQVLLVKASLDVYNSAAGTVTRVKMIAENISPTIQSAPVKLEYEAPPNTNLADVFGMAAQNLLSAIEENWKEKAAANLGDVKTVDVMVQVPDLGNFVNLWQRLQAMDEMRKIHLRAMTKDVAQLSLDVSDNTGDLAALFQRYNFALTQGAQIWLLQPL